MSGSGTLRVSASGSTDTRGRLEDANGNSLAENDGVGNFLIRSNVSSGTYYIRVSGTSSSTTGSYTLNVSFMEDTPPGSFDWIIRNFEVRRDTGGVLDEPVEPGWELGLGAAVQNIGSSTAPQTRVRFYQSADATISARDMQVADDNVVALDSGSIQGKAEIVLAPSTPGTYYYGACVDSVSGERDTTNNCSDGFRVVVASGSTGDDHGNDRASATRVSVPSDTAGVLTADDEDYFRFSLSRRGELEVYSSGNTDTVGYLENESRLTVAIDDDSGEGANFRIAGEILAGTY